MSHYLFIESNTTGTGEEALRRVLTTGHHVTFLTRTPALYPDLASEYARYHRIVLNTNDLHQVIDTAAHVDELHHVDKVLSFSTYYVATACAVATYLGLPTLHQAVAQLCHDKPRCLERLTDTHARHRSRGDRRWMLLDTVPTLAELVAATVSWSWPVVVKPPADSGSAGVFVARDPDAALMAVEWTAGTGHNVRGQPTRGVLLEEYIDGPEYSVETFTLHRGRTWVIGVTQKHLGPLPYAVEVGHDFPAPVLTAEERDTLVAAAVDALEDVGYNYGPAHVELRLRAGVAHVIEINPRLAGGMIPELVRRALGVDLLGATVALTPTEVELRLGAVYGGSASIRFITAPREGVLRGITVPDDFAGTWKRTARIGDLVRPARSALDRIGWVMATSSRSAVGAAYEVEAILERVRVAVEP